VKAKMVASIDVLSAGRVILGIGAGWVAAESAHAGRTVRRAGRHDRRAPAGDAGALAERRAGFDRKYTRFAALRVEPKPLRQPLHVFAPQVHPAFA
jgi:alkanesulfonate monooxygenase SsuD/methylene tetrahydromethanopterin reductase-like flavin-dependent oxidoreductase (luciferase family)